MSRVSFCILCASITIKEFGVCRESGTSPRLCVDLAGLGLASKCVVFRKPVVPLGDVQKLFSELMKNHFAY